MAISAVLPNGDLVSRDAGGRVGHPIVRMNQMRGRNTVILIRGRVAFVAEIADSHIVYVLLLISYHFWQDGFRK